ncbi:ABC transporter substrate-binding protein [Kibdelosporangium lantanae]|uniref:ABC transporter substrate-binding protein n=1 Tax=Kibdelosporangium lantanae TaxID=1497396 RepID=A0ABW3M2E0_9PSEU
MSLELSPMWRSPALPLAAVLFLLCGCSLLGGGNDDASATDGRVEKPKIKVAVLPTVETAPLQLAIKNGYFRDAGLEVDVQIAPSGQRTVEGLLGGDFDISYSTYPAFFQAQAKGVGDLKLVTDNSSAAPNTATLMVPKGSPVKSMSDLSDKTIAVTAKGTLADLMVKDTMATNLANWRSVDWREMPFPDMQAALASGKVDAAMVVEPFVTAIGEATGASVLKDLAVGPLNDFPFTGYGATKKFVNENPRTVAVFQRGMERAANEAQDNRANIEPLLPEFAKVDKSMVTIVHLPGFRTKLDANRLHRVVDLTTSR